MPRITKAMLTRAHAEMARKEDEAHAQAEAAEYAVDPDVDEVVVAHGVSSDEFLAIPRGWSRDVRLALRANGTLVVSYVESQQHRQACHAVANSTTNYASSHRQLALYTTREFGMNFGQDGFRIPDVSLHYRLHPLHPDSQPLVLIEVEVAHRSVRQIVKMAAGYMDHSPTTERVVVFKFFRPRTRALEAGLLQVPAMVLVFARATPATRTEKRVQIIAARSFGNVPIPRNVVAGLRYATQLEEHIVPRAQSREMLAHWGPLPADTLAITETPMNMFGLRATCLMPFHVPMPAPFPDLPFELFDVFEAAITGWSNDRAGRGAPRLAQP